MNLDLLPDPPLVPQMIAIEITQGINGLIDGRTLEVSLGFEVKEKLEDFLATQIRNMFIWIMTSELFDPAQVGTTGRVPETFKVDKAGELLIPILAGDYVV